MARENNPQARIVVISRICQWIRSFGRNTHYTEVISHGMDRVRIADDSLGTAEGNRAFVFRRLKSSDRIRLSRQSDDTGAQFLFGESREA